MLSRTSIFALLAAVMTFAAEGVNITVNARVDSHIGSVTLKAMRSVGGTQTLGPINRDVGETLGWWEVGTAYTTTVSSVDVGYTAYWEVTKSGQTASSKSGVLGNLTTITLEDSSYSGCALRFFGSPNTYAVTLNQQSGSGGTASVTATYDAAMPSITKPTRTGYTFGGYYTAANGGGTQYYKADGTSAKNWDRTSATTLYAKWTAIQYTVTLNQQSGSGGTASVTVTYNAAMPSITKPTRTGYTFGGYYTATNGGGTQYYKADGTSAKNWDRTSATTLYAKWTAIQYTVTLNQQDGSGGTASVRATYGSAMPSATMPTRKGYTFGGYYTAVNGGGTQYYTAAGASTRAWNIASNTTLYAKWVAKKYAITVNPRGGVFQGSSNAYTYDLSVKRLETGTSIGYWVPPSSRTGYTLTGYWDAASGGNKVYYASGYAADGTYWTGSGSAAKCKGISGSVTSLTVYAQWAVNTYTVTLDRQSGSGGSSSVTATYDKAMPSATMPTRTGYTFGGYYTAVNGGGTQYYTAAGASTRAWNIASNTTLYAKWVAKKYAITVNPRGGVFQGSSNAYTYDLSVKRLETGTSIGYWVPPSSRTGYTLTGYWDAASGGNKVYYASGYAADGTYWTGSGSAAKFKGISRSVTSLTVYAQWTPNSYPVTFVINGGTFLNGWTSTTNYSTGVGLTLPTAADVKRTDYTFVGWFEDEAFESDRVTRIDASETGARTFYAKWKGKTYVVAFNANGGLGQGTQELSMTESEQLKTCAALNIKAPTGYSFAGWNTAADGSGAPYADGAVIYNNLTNVANAIVTLYAQWTPNPYEVAFWPNGADGGETMPNQSFTYDDTQNLEHVAFTYTGYAFKEWSTATNYNNQTKYYADGAEVVNLATGGVVNLYANWTGIVYTVSFDANGGTGMMDPMVCTYDVPTNLPPCTFTCGSWEFQGWTTNAWTTNGAKDVHYANGARVTNLTTTAEVTLRACWKGPVTLDARDARGDGVITNVGEVVSVTNLFVGEKWDLPGATNTNPRLVFAPPNNGWCYWDAQRVMTSLPAYVRPDTTNLVVNWKWVADELAIAVDAPELEFSTFGTVGDIGKPNETHTNYNWFAQTDFAYGSTNAVQSGALPESASGSPRFVSWLTTKVKGKGVLSFWWRCDAQDVRHYLGKEYGDSLRFGLYDPEIGLYDPENGNNTEILRLTNRVEWCRVAYTNETESEVSFAWAFVYACEDSDNGGGTGWVDRVTWTPLDSEATSTHKVPYSWLRTNFKVDESTDLEAFAEGDSPSGKPMKVWEEYWTGTNPNDPNDLFRANIAVSNDVAHISWRPDLSVTGDPVRVYHVLSAPTPSAGWAVLQSNVVEEWEAPLPVMGDSGASTNRFFKVELDWEESQKKN